ncbi:MAG: 3-deoxy-D-manno-octulosonic acid transferase [Rhodospirillaceae bacterium]|nr:3-deoxy-D-manno-octulosonic acid transferase [Rhodospirillaceae bacterium]
MIYPSLSAKYINMPTIIFLYQLITSAGLPIIELLLRWRIIMGKEEAVRIEERRGVASLYRPRGPLIWIHAASLGEAQSVLIFIERLIHERPSLNILVTTGTVTSASLMKERLPKQAFHQFVPVDRLTWVRRFLNYWKPDLAIWVESELWPNLLLETSSRKIKMVLLNGRISASSYNMWNKFSKLAHRLLSTFTIVLTQDDVSAERFRTLGAKNIIISGNLKTSASPLPANASSLLEIQDLTGDRPLWLAASTHASEEIIIGQAHNIIRRKIPNLLTIIAPRHPQRSKQITKSLKEEGLVIARRDLAEKITDNTDIYLVDRTGELGLFYRITKIAFIGGSLIKHGGQNLHEAALLRCVVIHGPHMNNFQQIADSLSSAGASLVVNSTEKLAASVEALLTNPKNTDKMAEIAAETVKLDDSVLEQVMFSLSPLLELVESVEL